MTVQTEIYLADEYGGLRILGVREKTTLFQKNNLASSVENSLRQAIRYNDSALMGEIVAGLLAAAIQGGWQNAPGSYLLKHNGYMIGMGLYAPSGVKSDMTLTVRTTSSIC